MEPFQVTCPASLTIAHAAAFKMQLLEVPPERPVAIDASSASRVDGVGVQLLLAFIQGVESSGRTWSWSGCSAEVERAIGYLGLSEHFRVAHGETQP